VSTRKPDRAELLARMNQAGRQVSTAAILFHTAVADRLGLHATDHKCADFLYMKGPMTAGELAGLTGLTTGAITAVIDRLEKAGFVRREEDPGDRRRVIVRVLPKCHREIAPLFESFAAAQEELCARYSDRELAAILDYLTRSQQVAHEQTLKLRREAAVGRRKARGARGRRTRRNP
jgi:DNA-binding MarR family transcriptional regulator